MKALKINVIFKGGLLDGQSMDIDEITIENGSYVNTLDEKDKGQNIVEVYEFEKEENQTIAVHKRNCIDNLAPKMYIGEIIGEVVEE
ncbi:hypothetical protein HJ071_09995 [Vibrio parahaemolyticus]|nr:hypothetical protein [Vibrio parahaemolyticus]